MKQKNQVQNKSQINGVQKGSIKKQNAAAVTPLKASAAKMGGKNIKLKKQGKAPAKEVPPKKLIEEEEENDSEQDVEDDSGADVEISEQGSDGGNDLELDEDDEDDDEEDDDDEEEDDEDEEDDDEEGNAEEQGAEDSDGGNEESGDEPTEAPVGKKSKSDGKSLQVGNIPKDVPREQIIIVKNLPVKFKQGDLVEIFAQYGKITNVKITPNEKNTTAHIAFATVGAAKAALGANKTKVKDRQIIVVLQKSNTKKENNEGGKGDTVIDREESKKRTIYVKNLKSNATEEEVKEHFAECGTIESCKVKVQKKFCYAFVVFTEPSAVDAAIKLHNSVLGGSIIGVFSRNDHQNGVTTRDPKKTILIKNTQQLENFSEAKLKNIFSKCGEIDNIDIICKKNVLAFIRFKDEKSIKKAFKLSGTTAEGLNIEVEEFKIVPKTSVFLHNIKPGTAETDIREFFATTGELESVYIQPHYAIIKFKEVDAYCKSFLLNEGLLNGEMIFLEPYSEKKQSVMKKMQLGKRRASRPTGFNKGFNPKKFKRN